MAFSLSPSEKQEKESTLMKNALNSNYAGRIAACVF